MQTVREFTLSLQVYHTEIVGRLSFINSKHEVEETSLYSLSEINNMVALWKMDALLGSFAIDARLSDDAVMKVVQE